MILILVGKYAFYCRILNFSPKIDISRWGYSIYDSSYQFQVVEKRIEIPVEVPVPVPVPQEKIVEVPFPVEKIKRVKLVPQPEPDCEPNSLGIGKNLGLEAGLALVPGGFIDTGKGGKKLKKLLKHKLKKLL